MKEWRDGQQASYCQYLSTMALDPIWLDFKKRSNLATTPGHPSNHPHASLITLLCIVKFGPGHGRCQFLVGSGRPGPAIQFRLDTNWDSSVDVCTCRLPAGLEIMRRGEMHVC